MIVTIDFRLFSEPKSKKNQNVLFDNCCSRNNRMLQGGCLTLHITMHTSSDSSQPGYWLSSPAQHSLCQVMLVMSVLCASCWQTRQAEFQFHWETRTLLSRLQIPCRYLVSLCIGARFHFGSQNGNYLSYFILTIYCI